MDDPKHFRVVFLGENYVGKTFLINSFINGYFRDTSYTTGSPSYITKTIKYGNKNYSFDIWDTSGYVRYRSITKFLLKDANIIVLVYDTTEESTFLELDYWINTILTQNNPEVSFILVGNKSDLFENEQIKEKDGIKFAKALNAKFILTNAKDDLSNWSNSFQDALIDYLKTLNK